MGAIAVTKELQTVSNIFVFNLAVSDLLIGAIVDSFTAVGMCTHNILNFVSNSVFLI